MSLLESPMNYRNLLNGGFCYNNNYLSPSKTPTPQTQKTPISNEESRRLAGVVAKTRALFETSYTDSNNTNNKNLKQSPKTLAVKQSISTSNLANKKLGLMNDFDSDKENFAAYLPFINQNNKINNNAKIITRYQSEIHSPKIYPTKISVEPGHFYTSELNISINNDANKTPVANGLWSTSEELAKELKIPTSVRQAKMCFENFNKTSCQTPSKAFLNSQQRKLSDKCLSNGKLEESESMNRSDDALTENRLNSTSTAPAIYSTNSIGSTSSCETTPRTSSDPTSTSSIAASASLADSTIDEFDSINKNSIENNYNKNQISLKIKKLEKNLANNLKKNEETWNEDLLNKVNKLKESKQSLLMPSSNNIPSTTTTTTTTTTPKYSPKFMQLYQKQMSPAVAAQTPYKKLDELIKESEKTISTHQSASFPKPILRKVPSSSSISSNGSASNSVSSVDQQGNTSPAPQSPVSPLFKETQVKTGDLEVKLADDNLVRVDNSSCVLPSKMRQRSHSLADQKLIAPQQQQGNLNNNVNSTYTSYSAKPSFTSVNSRVNNFNGRSNGFVKNSPVTTSHTNNYGVAKRATRTNASNAKEGLLRWCRKMTDAYKYVSIDNFSSSWSDGLAFCALIHRFMPSTFDYAALSPENPRHNFELAFKIAEDKAGIVPLLDVEDMIEMGDSPDWKCVFTYVYSFYQRFKDSS